MTNSYINPTSRPPANPDIHRMPPHGQDVEIVDVPAVEERSRPRGAPSRSAS